MTTRIDLQKFLHDAEKIGVDSFTATDTVLSVLRADIIRDDELFLVKRPTGRITGVVAIQLLRVVDHKTIMRSIDKALNILNTHAKYVNH